MNILRDVTRRCMVSGAVVLALAVPFQTAQAGKVHVLYNFQGGSDGGNPFGSVIDVKGVLFGTTYAGGTSNLGAVFALAGDGTESVLHSFAGGSDGEEPETNLIADAKGNLYGTTYGGGTSGCGTVFKVTPSGDETTLVSFNCTDGSYPSAGVIADKAGDLFGTTYGAGDYSRGEVFKLAADGTESVFYSFKGGGDGEYPDAGLIADKKRKHFYGTTSGGGAANVGTVFEVGADGTESVLYAFKGGSDGSSPFANVVMDKAGNLYGTTYYGGGSGCSGTGCGIVFKVAPDGSETVLYAFAGGSDGMDPDAGVILDSKGNLYGTTLYGGGTGCAGNGCGTVFKLAPNGTKTTLYAFSGGDGDRPGADLIIKGKDLYGTTFNGGGSGCGGDGCGVVFRLKK